MWSRMQVQREYALKQQTSFLVTSSVVFGSLVGGVVDVSKENVAVLDLCALLACAERLCGGKK